MDKTLAGLLGAVGALMTASPGQAVAGQAPAQDVLQAASYADLLRPIPNAVEQLKALETEEAHLRVEPVQYYPYGYQPRFAQPYYGQPYYAQPYYAQPYYRGGYNHHHHHHHHRYFQRYHHHHHHNWDRD